MALLTEFSPKEINRTSVHEKVDATFHIFEKDGETFLQIDTYGAEGRKFAGKVSQSIQLGKAGRHALIQLLAQISD